MAADATVPEAAAYLAARAGGDPGPLPSKGSPSSGAPVPPEAAAYLADTVPVDEKFQSPYLADRAVDDGPEEVAAYLKEKRGGDGMGMIVQDKRLREPKTFEGQIEKGRHYQNSDGFVGHALDALDYLGNAARSGLDGVVSGGAEGVPIEASLARGWLYAKQALKKERGTSFGDLKGDIGAANHLGSLKFADQDRPGWSQPIAKAADFGVDVAGSIATDPLMAIGELGEAAKGLAGGAKGAAELKAGVESAGASRAAKAALGGRAVAGGILGYGSQDAEAPEWQKIAAATAGAGTGMVLPSALSAGREQLVKGMDAASDWYATATRGDQFAGFSKMASTANEAYQKAKGIATWIAGGRDASLEGLDQGMKGRVTDVMHELKNESVTRRNRYLQDYLQANPGGGNYDLAFNKITNRVNDEVAEEVMPGVLKEAFPDPDEYRQGVDAVNKWADHNMNVIGRLNEERFGRSMGDVVTGKTATGIPGLRFHVDDLNFDKMQKAAARAAQKFDDWKYPASTDPMYRGLDENTAKAVSDITGTEMPKLVEGANDGEREIHQASTGKTQKNPLTPDESYAQYASNFSKQFLDKVENGAIKFMQDYRSAPVGGATGKFEQGLKTFDNLTGFAKANMLYFSTHWLRTQLFDNLSKAYVEGGFGNLAKATYDSTLGGLVSDLGKDVRAIMRGESTSVLKTSEAREALEMGVLDNMHFDSLRNDLTKKMLYSPSAVKGASDSKIAGWIRNGGQYLLEKNPVVGAVRSVGSYMEGAVRLSTYKRAKEMFLEAGIPLETAKKSAADLVEKTFFDYGNVTHMEDAVMKRLMPFYTFYSKNMPYWARAVFDPQRLARISQLDKFRSVQGKTPTADQTAGMTQYISQNAPRFLGKDGEGNKHYSVSPVDPRVEALKMLDLRHLKDTLQERVNPLLKTPVELATGHDFFTDDNVYPSSNKDGKKFLFGRGFKWAPLEAAGRALGAKPGWSGFHVDERGNPYSTSDLMMAGTKAVDTLFPSTFAEQVAGGIGKNMYGREKVGTTAVNTLQPFQDVSVSPGLERATRARNAAKNKGD